MGAGGLFHFRVKIDPDKPESHLNIEPLCNRESERLTGTASFGYMTDKKESVQCLACLMILERQTIDNGNI